MARARPGDIVHIEGWFRPALLVPLVVAARLRGCSVGLNPHTTFSRRGRSFEEQVVRWMARRADVVFAISHHDRRRIEGWGARAVEVKLAAAGPAPDDQLVAGWRRRWGAEPGRPAILFAGQVRRDKGLDVLVRAAAGWAGDRVVAVVGEDRGALAGARRLAGELGVTLEVDEGYQPLPQFVAAVNAADVVVCPYRAASQSAVLTLATALGRPTVATQVGGLAELATVAVPPEDPEALRIGIGRALAAGPTAAVPNPATDVARPYLEAYGLFEPAVR